MEMQGQSYGSPVSVISATATSQHESAPLESDPPVFVPSAPPQSAPSPPAPPPAYNTLSRFTAVFGPGVQSTGPRSVIVNPVTSSYNSDVPESSSNSGVPEVSRQEDPGDLKPKKHIDFSQDKTVKLGFVKKVYAILVLQILVTGGIMCIFMYIDKVKVYSHENRWLFITAICVYVLLAWCVLVGHVFWDLYTSNYILTPIMLFLVTVTMGVMLGSIVTYLDEGGDTVLKALMIICGVAVLMSGFGFQTRYDFTWGVGFRITLVVSLLGFGILCAAFRDGFVQLTYAWLGAVVFSVLVCTEIWWMINGWGITVQTSRGYMFGSVKVYTDIITYITIFVIVWCLPKKKKNIDENFQ